MHLLNDFFALAMISCACTIIHKFRDIGKRSCFQNIHFASCKSICCQSNAKQITKELLAKNYMFGPNWSEFLKTNWHHINHQFSSRSFFCLVKSFLSNVYWDLFFLCCLSCLTLNDYRKLFSEININLIFFQRAQRA